MSGGGADTPRADGAPCSRPGPGAGWCCTRTRPQPTTPVGGSEPRPVGICGYCRKPVLMRDRDARCACGLSDVPADFFETTRRLAATYMRPGRSVL